MSIDTYELFEELKSVLRHYDGIHRTAEDARIAHTTVERQVADIRRAYLEDVYAEVVVDPHAKVRYSNQERKEHEAQRRMEQFWPELLLQEKTALRHKEETASELRRSEEAVKTYRALAGLHEAEKRMEAVMADVASMPRMIRR